MNTLTLQKRRLYMLIFLALFVLIFPVLILYSMGYRLRGMNFVPAGALYLSVASSGFEVSLNGEPVKTTNFFQKSYFNQNLKPGKYVLSVTKDGYYPWKKELDVYEKEVTEAFAFNIRKEPILAEIFPFQVKGVLATTSPGISKAVINPALTSVAEMFGFTPVAKISYTILPSGKKQSFSSVSLNNIPQTATTSKLIQTSLKIPREKEKNYRKMAIWQEGNNIYAEWTGRAESAPYFFCNDDICKDKILIYAGKSPSDNFDFYPGRNDLVIISSQNVVFVTDIDDRSAHNVETLYDAYAEGIITSASLYTKVDFRVADYDRIYIRIGNQFFEIDA